jgi:hypothetical protein
VQARGERRTAILPKTGTRRGPENARTQRHPAFAGQRRTALLHDPASAASPAAGIPGA